MSALPPKADIRQRSWHVRFGPCVDGSELARTLFTFAALGGAAMCSACSCGTRKAAGHNALRGSGPGRNVETGCLNCLHDWLL
jgi:hypothetical protein